VVWRTYTPRASYARLSGEHRLDDRDGMGTTSFMSMVPTTGKATAAARIMYLNPGCQGDSGDCVAGCVPAQLLWRRCCCYGEGGGDVCQKSHGMES
jgi:hypothetical protein